MNILVDWLTFTIKEYPLRKFLDEINFTTVPYTTGLGWHGKYERTIRFGDILIAFNGSFEYECQDMFTISMSGKGCRQFEDLHSRELDWLSFISKYMRIVDNDYSTAKAHIARLDIACDDKPENNEQPILDFKKLRNHYEKDKFICKAKKHHQKRGTYTEEFEQCIYFGSASGGSERICRIYNKALERTESGHQYDGHWIRCEMQLRNDSALSFYLKALEIGNIGECFSGMLLDYLRFTTEPNKRDHNQGRLKVCKWWLDFCNHSAKIKGFKIGGAEYNLDILYNYLHTQCSSSLLTYLAIHDGDFSCLNGILEDASLSPKQEKLLNEIRFNRANEKLNDIKEKLIELGVPTNEEKFNN